jgi:tetratricopeptide (TPR) repeat protein
VTTPFDPPGAEIISVISPVGGVGRTSTVVNVGWILASAGRRVLVVDLDDQPPDAKEYLEPFHVEDVRSGALIGDSASADLGRLVAAGWGLPGLTDRPGEDGDLTVSRYSLPGGTAQLDLVKIQLRAPATRTLTAAAGPQVQLRARLRALQYEYILLDNPTTRPEEQRGLVSRLVLISDVVALCFRPVGSELPQARQLAADIRAAAAERPRVIAVPTQVQGRYDRGGPDQPLLQLRAAFAGIPVVRIPYRSYHYSRSLAVLLDDPADTDGPLAAYEQLTERITNGAVDKLRPVSNPVRRRFERALGLDEDAEPESVTICYAPPDRPWAEWLQGQFEQVELRVSLSTAPPGTDQPAAGTVVVVHSDQLAGSAVGDWHAAHPEVPYDLVAIWVGRGRGAPVPPGDVDLRGFTGERAQAELRGRLAMAATVTPSGPRWPGRGRTAPRTNLLGSTKSFVGRRDELETLREALIRDQLRLLTGAPGTGKSKLIREYVDRYGHDYDHVWLLAADNPAAVRASLAELGEVLGVDAGGDPVGATLDELASTHRPWLLVYHNATDPDALLDLLPRGGRGHAVITAPPGAWPAGLPLRWPAHWAEQAIEPFAAAEAVRLLRRYVAELTDADANQVVSAAGNLPIALRLVGAYLEETVRQFRQRAEPVAEAAALAAREFLGLHRVARQRHADPTAACLSVLLDTVVRATARGRLALRLAQLCTYLPPDAISLTLLTSRGMIEQLIAAGGEDGAILAGDAVEVHRVLHTATEYSLFAVDWGTAAAVRMHRLMQRVIREAMSPDERTRRREQVLRGLAAYAPSGAETDTPARLGRSAELAPYLEPSGALDSPDRAVRAWLVQHVRYLYQDGDATTWRAALETGTRLLARWREQPTQPPDDDDLRLRLAIQVANLHRALGDYEAARLLDEQILLERRGSIGLDHPRTLRAARGLGGDLRGLGQFRQAVGYDQATREGFLRAYGPDHPDTLMATNNVALSAYLVGSLETAFTQWSGLAERRLRLLGETDPTYWNAVARTAMCVRELGDHDAAWHHLREALQHVVQLRPPDHLDGLRIRHDLAITERLAGRYDAALDREIEVLGKLQAALGEDHPETQAARMALAADHLEVGNTADALALGQRCLTWHTTRFGADHPFTLACASDVAIFEQAAGEPDAALERGGAAVEGLAAAVGRTHPWTLAARLNLACYRAAGGDHAEAVALTEHIQVRCIDSLGTNHPYTLRAADNLAALRTGSRPRPIHLDIPRV